MPIVRAIVALGVPASDPSCSNLTRKLLERIEKGWTPVGATKREEVKRAVRYEYGKSGGRKGKKMKKSWKQPKTGAR